MLKLAANYKVFLAIGSTDMRKSINSLSVLVSEQMELDIFSGHLFVFCNRKKNIIKVLYWDRNGFCLWHKRLEEDDGPTVSIARMPEQIIPKSIATPRLLAHIMTARFADALPFYRQEKQFTRIGIELPRSTSFCPSGYVQLDNENT